MNDFKYQKHLSFGITTEKDAGETIFGNPLAEDLFETSTPRGFALPDKAYRSLPTSQITKCNFTTDRITIL